MLLFGETDSTPTQRPLNNLSRRRAKFRVVFGGYQVAEVDRFIRGLDVELMNAEMKNAELKEMMNEISKRYPGSGAERKGEVMEQRTNENGNSFGGKKKMNAAGGKRNVKFRRSVRGYDRSQVMQTVRSMLQQLEELEQQNLQLEDEIRFIEKFEFMTRYFHEKMGDSK